MRGGISNECLLAVGHVAVKRQRKSCWTRSWTRLHLPRLWDKKHDKCFEAPRSIMEYMIVFEEIAVFGVWLLYCGVQLGMLLFSTSHRADLLRRTSPL